MSREFEILPQPSGGWRLVLIEDGVEMGGGVFGPDDEEYCAALDVGSDWAGGAS